MGGMIYEQMNRVLSYQTNYHHHHHHHLMIITIITIMIFELPSWFPFRFLDFHYHLLFHVFMWSMIWPKGSCKKTDILQSGWPFLHPPFMVSHLWLFFLLQKTGAFWSKKTALSPFAWVKIFTLPLPPLTVNLTVKYLLFYSPTHDNKALNLNLS